MNVDIRALAIVMAITSGLQIIALILQYALNKTYRGIGWWVLWAVSTALGFSLIPLRDFTPAGLTSISIILTNALLLVGWTFLYVGIMRFLDKKEHRGIIIALFAVFILSTFYFVYVNEYVNARSVILYGAVAIIGFLAAQGLFVNKTRSFAASANFISAVLFTSGCFLLFRTMEALTVAPIENVFDPTRQQIAVFLVTLVTSGLCTLGLIIMVSQRSNADMREAKEQFELIFNTGPDASIIARLNDGLIVNINEGFTALTGFTRDEAIGKLSLDANLWKDPADRQYVFNELGEKGLCNNYEAIFQMKGGRQIGVTMSAKIITLQGVQHIISIMRDITDRKRLEEEQQRVEKLESVGLLAGGIAHDFNNILTTILGNISLASMEAAPGSELLNSLEQAEKASLRAKALTKQLLTFARGGAPVTKLASLTALLKDTAGFALRGANVKCNFSIPSDLWHAKIDEGQVSQVMHNLVLNAQQAMPAGGSIELTAENMALSKTQSLGKGLPLKKGNYIRIAVTDHGTGMDAEHLAKIFDPFFTTKQKGSGLGLATSFSIARQHGGHLSVESVVGSGSTFYVYLPASMETLIPKQDKIEHVKAAGKASILVMDDEEAVREVAGRMLKHLGYDDVEFAADGAEAIKLYKAAMASGNPFNVVILDLTIPGGMGGKETVKKLLKIDPGVKAIVSSGYVDDSVSAKYKEHGFSGMIAKPYTLEQLRKALEDVIG